MTTEDPTPQRADALALSALPRLDVAGLTCTLSSIDHLVAAIASRLRNPDADAPTVSILCVNAHIFNLAWNDPSLRRKLVTADIVALDGMSMVWAARWAGASGATRCNMTEAFRAFLLADDVPPTRALVIGLDADGAHRAASAIITVSKRVRVADALDGYQEVTAYVDAVTAHPYDLVVVGCGTPRSEEIIAALAATGRPALAWHVGGGTLRFLAGDDREAPVWMRRSGLQWLHRLLRHPRELWRRYLVGLPTFAWRAFRHPRTESVPLSGPADDGS